MKKPHTNRLLELKKTKISRLDQDQMNQVKGGVVVPSFESSLPCLGEALASSYPCLAKHTIDLTTDSLTPDDN